MITEPHVNDYINSLSGDLPPYLDRLEQYALEAHVPIIRKEAQSFLCFLIREYNPSRILEIGTAVGFSAQLMAEASKGTVTTIEKVEMRLKEARKNLKCSPNADRITLIEGDALSVLKELEGPYDFIFLDAAKGQYMNFLKEIMRLLPVGGHLLTDNVLQEGSLAGSKFAVERRDRTIHMRMREYLYTITHSDRLDTVILPVGDGMALSRKI
jgi:predicted O-methyltransferase YrrM